MSKERSSMFPNARTAGRGAVGERRSGRLRGKRPTAPEWALYGLRCAESLALTLAGLLAWQVVPDLGEVNRGFLVSIFGTSCFAVWLAGRLGAYRDGYVFSAVQLRYQLSAWAGAIAAWVLIVFAADLSREVSRTWVVLWLGFGALALAAVRPIFFYSTRVWALRGAIAQRTVVVGTGANGRRLAEHLSRQPDLRTRIIGFADDGDATARPAYIGAYRVVGGVARVREMIRHNEVDQVVIALPWSERERIINLTATLAELPVHVALAPDLLQFEFSARRWDLVGGIPLLRVVERPVSGHAELLKVAEDFLLGSILLLGVAPIMLLVALAIKVDSPGPIFFRQTRYGFNNKLIRIWKFRTMHHHLTDAEAAVLTQRDDPRVTRLGRFLRRTSLDELPQLFNVLSGEMSLVGPRPHALQAKAGGTLYQDVMINYAARYRVKPGLTGWAQVNGWRGETDTHEKLIQRVQHDLYYIDNWSLWLDLRILLRTVSAVLKAGNAF